jgi:hypothetical protein
VHRQQTRNALDHDAPHVRERLADERNAPRLTLTHRRNSERFRTHPFRTGSCLAGAAPAEDQPNARQALPLSVAHGGS